MDTNSANQQRLNRILVGIVVFLLLVIVGSSILFMRANRPMHQAKEEAAQVAKKYAGIEEVDQFYWFNREKTYFTVTGKDKENKEIVAIIPKSGEKIHVYDQSEGLTQEQVEARFSKEYPALSLEKVSLGMFKDQAAWEVAAKNNEGTLGYYLLSFKDGQTIKEVKGL